jgi:hypothetical protein
VTIQYSLINSRVIMNRLLGRMWKEAPVAYFKHLIRSQEKIQETHCSVWSVTGRKFEAKTSWIRRTKANHYIGTFEYPLFNFPFSRRYHWVGYIIRVSTNTSDFKTTLKKLAETNPKIMFIELRYVEILKLGERDLFCSHLLLHRFID